MTARVAARAGPFAGRVSRYRAQASPSCYSVPAISRLLLAAVAGALAVTCISAVLVLLSPVPTDRERATQDGRNVLDYLWRNCGERCTVRAETQTTLGTWRVQLQTPRWRRCFLITPHDYAYVPGRGVVGLSATACR